jgi:hypothetical protein
MNADQIKYMVDRFLMWPLPRDFTPDNGISYKRPNYAPNVPGPSGTNLLDATQADAMVRHMVEGLPVVNSHATLTTALVEARGALEPFSAKAESDIGSDESDRDLFRPMMQHNEAPHIRVGDLRRARAALATINAALGRVEG